MFNPLQPDYQNHPGSSGRAAFPYTRTQGQPKPRVALVTPFHNTGAVFEETVASVQRQSFVDFEWLIIDDATSEPEALAQLAALVALDDPRFRVLQSEENVGVSAARNAGVAESSTPFVAFLDSDDLLEPTALEKWLWFLETQPAFSFVNGEVVGFGAMEYHWTEGFHTHEKLFERNLANPIGMYRRAFLEEVGGYDETIVDGFEDWDFWLRAATKGLWGRTLPDPLIWYRRRGEVHDDRWADFDGEGRSDRFRDRMIEKYGALRDTGFPQPVIETGAMGPVRDEIPFTNPLALPKATRRVLMILPHVEMGGSDKFTLDLARGLAAQGVQITVATTLGKQGGSWLQEMEAITPDVFVMGRFLVHADYPRFLAYLAETRQVETVLVSHSMLGYQLLPWLRRRLPKVVFTDYLHIDMPDWKSGGYPRFHVHYQDHLDRGAVSSEHLRSWLVERGAKEEKIEIVTTNVDPREWDPARHDATVVREKYGLDPKALLILFAGRLVAQKQPKLLAAVSLELARKAEAPFQIVIAGDGDDGPWLRAFVAEHAEVLEGRVVLLGEVSNEAVRELLAASEVFFLPSENEGIALSLFEAMSMGTAVVGAAVGGQAELIDKKCGVLIKRESFEQEQNEYGGALCRFIEDPDFARRCGEAGRARIIEGFTLEQMIDRMTGVLSTPRSHEVIDFPRLGLHVAEICEQARLEDEATALWKECVRLGAKSRKRGEKLEDFRAMKARRDEKIARLEAKVASLSAGKGRRRYGLFGPRVKADEIKEEA